MSFIENRKDYRLPFKRKFILGNENCVFSGQSINLSMSGAFICVLKRPDVQVGHKLRCVFSINEDKAILQVDAQVKRIVAPSPNPEVNPGIGLEFIRSKEEDRKLLKEHIINMKNGIEKLSAILNYSDVDLLSLESLLRQIDMNSSKLGIAELKHQIDRTLQSIRQVEEKTT